MTKKILITGACGYTGTKLVEHLTKQNFKVFSLARKTGDAVRIQNLQKISQVCFYENNYESLNKIFKENQIDFAIHVAALAKYSYESEKIDDMINSNFRLGLHLLEAMSNNNCSQFINFSTYWQNNENNKAICLYAALKKAFEGMIDFYSFDKKLNAISLRFTEIYGPDDSRPKLFTQLKKQSHSVKMKMTKGDQEINLIYIDDLTAAIENCLTILQNSSESSHLVYDVYSDETLTPKDVLNIYNKETGKNIEGDWGALPYYKNQIMKLNLGKLLPNFKAKYKLKDTIKKL